MSASYDKTFAPSLRKYVLPLGILLYGIFIFKSENVWAKTSETGNEILSLSDLTAKGDLRPVEKIHKSDEEWKKMLTDEQFQVTRKGGTECAYTGKYFDQKKAGVYRCICCGAELFNSDAKFESGTGWPSYWKPVSENSVYFKEDNSHFMKRTEVLCSRCDAHLGHVFDDGPPPTYKRYCINSAALEFIPSESPSH